MVERMLVIIASILVFASIGLYVGGATLSADYSLELQDPKIWSSRFPETALVQRAIHRDIKLGANCSAPSHAGSDALPKSIAGYGALMPNEPSVMIALAQLARACGRGSEAIPLIRRALALGKSDIEIVLDSYRFRRFFGFRDPALAEALDQKLVSFWQQQPRVRRDIARMIKACWSCRIQLEKAAPDVYEEIAAFGKR